MTKEVLDEYNKSKSIKRTARALEISEGVVRKVLIGYGILDTPLIRRIAELRAAGMPQKDIADLLKISISNVNANTPYERGTYLSNAKTANAVRIKKCREKQKKGEEG